jgi:hypothetical protein
VNSAATKQVENKFEYYKKKDGGYTNKAFYNVFDTDLIIKKQTNDLRFRLLRRF